MKDDDATQSAEYKIGYGKPPKSGQFVKGKSGNPRGRPRSKFRPKPSEAADEPTTEMILQEAYRLVKVKEGDKLTSLPVSQAVLRGLAVAAMRGNRPAQIAQIEMLERAEAKRRKARTDTLKEVVEYKTRWQRMREFYDAAGIPLPEPTPHPEDFIIDWSTGDVRLLGPANAEQKERLDESLADLDDGQEIINEIASLTEMSRPLKSLRLKAQRRFDEVNQTLPKRYQKTLQNRL